MIPVLYRYLIAYGGHVSSSLEDSATTHICKETSFGSDTVKSEIPAISPEWILACHAAQEILPLNALSRLA